MGGAFSTGRKSRRRSSVDRLDVPATGTEGTGPTVEVFSAVEVSKSLFFEIGLLLKELKEELDQLILLNLHAQLPVAGRTSDLIKGTKGGNDDQYRETN